MDLDRNFREFVASFLDNDVQFLVVGGYALAAHGVPRYTGDLDAWILVSTENAAKVLTAIEEFGFGELGLDLDDFTADDRVIQLGYPPLRIDILTSIDGVQFDSAWGRRLMVSIEGLDVPFISRDDTHGEQASCQ
jgi:hypothetical protein